VLYPFAVYFGLQYITPRLFALFLTVMLVLRFASMTNLWRYAQWRSLLPLLIGSALTSLLVLLSNQSFWFKLHPVIISVGFLAIFAWSLWFPPSMIERFARLQKPDLPPQAVAYTRKVTMLWSVFFLLNGLVALWTVWLDLRIWLLYNGMISYLLIGLLLGGELLYRRLYLDAV
jgi:uncharacterized membrane protein